METWIDIPNGRLRIDSISSVKLERGLPFINKTNQLLLTFDGRKSLTTLYLPKELSKGIYKEIKEFLKAKKAKKNKSEVS